MDKPSESVEVVYALPDEQFVDRVPFETGLTARVALKISQIPDRFPDLDSEHCPLGVWGKSVADSYRLSAGDRVEVYRPLANDPRDERRNRAQGGGTMGIDSPTKLD